MDSEKGDCCQLGAVEQVVGPRLAEKHAPAARGAAKGGLIRAAASTPPFGGFFSQQEVL